MPTELSTIHSRKAPAAIGAYNQAIKIDKSTLYISGQLGFDPTTMQLVQGGIEAQIHQVMANLTAVLEGAGGSVKDLVKTTILLHDIKDFETVNRVYESYLCEPYPARSTYQVRNLPKGGLVEIEAIAVVGVQTAGSIWKY